MRARDLLRLQFSTWVPAVAWTLLTVAASGDLLSSEHTGGFVVWFFKTFFPHAPYAWMDITHTFLRKLGHFVNYAILSWLWFRAFRYWELREMLREQSRQWALRWSRFGFLLAALTAIADETLQHFVPSRTGSVQDVALDGAGALFAQLLILRVWLWRKSKAGNAESAEPTGKR